MQVERIGSVSAPATIDPVPEPLDEQTVALPALVTKSGVVHRARVPALAPDTRAEQASAGSCGLMPLAVAPDANRRPAYLLEKPPLDQLSAPPAASDMVNLMAKLGVRDAEEMALSIEAAGMDYESAVFIAGKPRAQQVAMLSNFELSDAVKQAFQGYGKT